MKIKKWTNITAATGGGNKLPSGAYAVRVVSVTDVPDKELLEVIYDIAEGEHKGHYSTEWGMKNTWAHRFNISYSDKSEKFFKHWLEVLEASNPSFSVAAWEATANEQAFVGKVFGAAWGTEYYTYKGENKDRPTFANYFSIDDFHNGNFKIPDDIDNRENKEEAAEQASTDTYSDVPFF